MISTTLTKVRNIHKIQQWDYPHLPIFGTVTPKFRTLTIQNILTKYLVMYYS